MSRYAGQEPSGPTRPGAPAAGATAGGQAGRKNGLALAGFIVGVISLAMLEGAGLAGLGLAAADMLDEATAPFLQLLMAGGILGGLPAIGLSVAGILRSRRIGRGRVFSILGLVCGGLILVRLAIGGAAAIHGRRQMSRWVESRWEQYRTAPSWPAPTTAPEP